MIVANWLLDKRIVFFEKRQFPLELFPNEFDRHPYAVPALIEILNAEPGFHPLRAVLHRKTQMSAEIDESAEIFAARLARIYGITRDRAGDTLEYLQRIGFVVIEQQSFSRKKVAQLTANGRQAAIWLEENFAPNLLSYLEKTYPHDRLTKLLRGLRPRSRQERRSTPSVSDA